MSTNVMIRKGHYKTAARVRLIESEKGKLVALCDYPLRIVPLSSIMARILQLCHEEHSCNELATLLALPVKRIETICDAMYWKSLLEAGPVVPPATWPTVTIVIPSYNRAIELQRCIRALFLLSYPHDYVEIVVVDDASVDATPMMLSSLAAEAMVYSMRLRSIRHVQRRGVAASRNTGADASTTDLIAYIDSDCVADSAWLTELVPLFQDERIAVVGGMTRSYDCRNVFGRYEDTCSSLYMGKHTQKVQLDGPLTYVPTANFIMRRATWQQLGGFAPLVQGEDVDFCRRVLLSGSIIRYEPRGIVYHDYRTTLSSFLKIRAAYATAEAALLQRYPTERRVLFLPPEQASFAALVLGSLWAILRLLLRLFLHTKNRPRVSFVTAACCTSTSLMALSITAWQARERKKTVRQQHLNISFATIFTAIFRGNCAYTYHLYRHLTRYYTLPLVLLALCLSPFAIPIVIMLCTVVLVDYWRLSPSLDLLTYACCAMSSDCAYEVGVVQGCIQQGTWKPLLPVVRRQIGKKKLHSA